MTHHVIDVNVPIVANQKHTEAGEECILACITYLQKVIATGTVVLDDDQVIFSEYQRHLDFSGQPGVGDLFFRWLWANQAVASRCQKVPLTRCSHGFEYEEFPHEENLIQFDPDDKIFVAVAISSGNDPELANAVDSDWFHYKYQLIAQNLNLKFLCGEDIFASE